MPSSDPQSPPLSTVSLAYNVFISRLCLCALGSKGPHCFSKIVHKALHGSSELSHTLPTPSFWWYIDLGRLKAHLWGDHMTTLLGVLWLCQRFLFRNPLSTDSRHILLFHSCLKPPPINYWLKENSSSLFHGEQSLLPRLFPKVPPSSQLDTIPSDSCFCSASHPQSHTKSPEQFFLLALGLVKWWLLHC